MNIYAKDGTLHCIPMNDDKQHKRSAECWCEPEETVDGHYYVHNSADGREAFEKGERKPS